MQDRWQADMSNNTANWCWSGLFAALFLLSQDFWFWDDVVKLGPANFPLRIYYFLILQLMLSVSLALVVRRLLRKGPDEAD